MKIVFIGCFISVIFSCSAQEFLPWSYGNLIGNSYGADDYGCGVSIVDINLDGKDDFTLINAYDPCTAYITNDSAYQVLNLPFNMQDEVRQISWVDFDNDGDRDLFMTGRNMSARLYRNTAFIFEDVSLEFGFLPDAHTYYGHAWTDFDRDGDLDVFVANYDQEYAGYTNFRNCLYRQNSFGTFDEVGEELGIVTEMNYSFMGLWTDINKDLWPDLFIINDRNLVPNDLFLNNGDGTFSEISEAANMRDYILSMSATQGDYNNDGLLDYYITNNPSGNLHKKNLGNNTFLDVAELLGTQLNLFSWSAQFTDFDCDGWEDLHVCVSPHINYPHQNQILKNIGEFFVAYTDQSGMIPDDGWSRGSAVGDLNDDGFQDIIVSKSYPSVTKFWLAVPNENNWLKVSLQGINSNVEGIGSWITCHKGNHTFSRYTNCGESYLAQNSFMEHFGLGGIEVLDSIVIEWISGQRDVWRRVPVRQSLHLIEGGSANVRVQATTASPECAEMTQQFSALVSNGEILWMNGDTTFSTSASANEWVHFLWTDSLGNRFYSDSIQVISEESEFFVSLHQPDCESYEFGSAELIFNDSLWTLPLLLNDSMVEVSYLDSLEAGYYNASIISLNGCLYATTFSVDSLRRPINNVSWLVSDVQCFGANDGVVQFFTNLSDSIQWSLLDTSLQQDALSAGQYEFLIWDSTCYDTLMIEVFQPEQLLISFLNEPDEISGNYNLSPIASGGSPPYAYVLDDMEVNADSSLIVIPGQHLLQVFDSHQCMVDTLFYLDFAVGVNSMNPHFSSQKNGKLFLGSGDWIICDAAGRVLRNFINEKGCEGCLLDLPSGIYFAVDLLGLSKPTSFAIIQR